VNAGALNLLDHVLPEVPIRQFVITMPFPLRFTLAFAGKLLPRRTARTPSKSCRRGSGWFPDAQKNASF
jgi:hypothetical protein